MNSGQKLLAMLGRMCLSLIFILAGIGKILDWNTYMEMVQGAFAKWVASTEGTEMLHSFFQMLSPYAGVLLAIATVFELLGGLLVFFGMKVRLGAFLLVLFLIPTTILVHHFWFLEGADHVMQRMMVLHNLALLGGLFLVLAYGKGSSSSSKKA